MKYIFIDDDKIKRYNVLYDNKKLLQIKNEIIENCSTIKHRIVQSDYEPFDYRFNTSTYRNVSRKVIGEKEYDVETRTVYEYEYDEYIHPNLVMLIDDLLKNKKSAIVEIFNYKNNDLDIDKEIDDLNKEIDSLDNFDTENKINKLKELKKLYNDKKLNENKKPIELYLDKVKELIKFDLIDEIYLNEYKKIDNVLNINYKFDESIKLTRKK